VSEPNNSKPPPPEPPEGRGGPTETIWIAFDPRFTPNHLGYLPEILRADDPRPVKAQLEDRYAHGGGWRPIKGFALDPDSLVLAFPEDPPYRPAAACHLGKELVIFYPQCQLLCVVQRDGAWEVTRVD
jgi:hypothetical protein